MYKLELNPPEIFGNNIWTIVWYLIIAIISLNILIAFLKVSRKKNNKNAVKTRTQKVRKNLSDEELIRADIDSLSGSDFERLIEMYYKDQGYQVKRVGGSGDHEVDLILLGKEGYKIAVQCKRWRRDVGNDPVLRLKSGKQVYGCYDAWIITTSDFTKAAKEAAERLNIKLINGLIIRDKLNRWKKKKFSELK